MITEEKITLGPWGEIVSGEIKRIKKCSAEEFRPVRLKMPFLYNKCPSIAFSNMVIKK